MEIKLSTLLSRSVYAAFEISMHIGSIVQTVIFLSDGADVSQIKIGK